MMMADDVRAPVRSKKSEALELRERILTRAGLEEPDGRPLRRYHVTDEEYCQMSELLRSKSAFLSAGNPALDAIFGLFVAEWFRREATSTAREWEPIGIVPVDMEPSERTELVERSLRAWKVELKRSVRGREALLSLALQGGVPIRILKSELDTSLSRFFRRLMGEAIAAGHCDEAFLRGKAGICQELLPETLRDPLIVEQAVEAVHALSALRRRIPGTVSDDAAIDWLDTNESAWRETIPLHLPDDVSTLDVLFGEMLREPPARIRRELKVTRILDWNGGPGWRTGIALPTSGSIPPEAFDLSQHSEGRFLLHLRGEASVAFPGSLGYLYHRPGRGAIKAALSCELGRNAEAEAWGVPLSEPVHVRLTRSDTEPFERLWPGGAARRSDVISFREIEAGRFELAGTGSVRSPAEALLVIVPNKATVTAEGVAPVERLAEQGDEALWRIEGIATVEADEARYRLTCGTEADARWLEIPESWHPCLRLVDRAMAMMERGRTPRRCRENFNGEVDEGRVEITARRGTAGEGRLTCTWRDDEGFVIDRQRLFVLPPSARIEAREGVQRGARVEWSGLPGWTVAGPDGTACAAEDGGIDVDLGTAARISLVLTDPGGAETALTVDLIVRDAHLVDRDFHRIERRSVVTLDRMNTLRLRLPGKQQVDLLLRGGEKPLIHAEALEGEVPVQTLHDAATHLFALAGEQDARIELQVDGGRSLCQLSRPRARLQIEDPHVNIPMESRPDREDWQAVARPLVAGDREYRLDEAHPPWSWTVPENIERPCMVYLRTARGVLTRPQVIPGPQITSDPWTEALTQGNAKDRENAVLDLLESAVGDASLLKRIRGIIVSLRGLSPQSTDILRLLDQRPDTLCSLVLSANAEERAEIFALSERLPFLWPGLPVEAWQCAAQRQTDALTRALNNIYDDAPVRAMRMVRDTLAAVAEDRPWFNGIREALGETVTPSETLYDIANRHVREVMDRSLPPRGVGHVVRERGIPIPDDLERLNHSSFPTLLAPLVLAARATEPFDLGTSDRWALRTALMFDRDYVTHAYPHCLRFLRS